jgi:hypothetical protein
MRAIFISYRRDDSEGQAGRLYDDLSRRFGGDSVFMDVAAIEPGLDFRKVIDHNVASCGVLLAVIGPGWLDAKDQTGQRRLDNPTDFVRLETASALKRDIPVVPVLVHGARMPAANQLPEDLGELAYRNGLELTHARWDSDIEVLVKALQRHVKDDASPEQTSRAAAAAPGSVAPANAPPVAPVKNQASLIAVGLVAAAGIAFGLYMWMHRSPTPEAGRSAVATTVPVQSQPAQPAVSQTTKPPDEAQTQAPQAQTQTTQTQTPQPRTQTPQPQTQARQVPPTKVAAARTVVGKSAEAPPPTSPAINASVQTREPVTSAPVVPAPAAQTTQTTSTGSSQSASNTPAPVTPSLPAANPSAAYPPPAAYQNSAVANPNLQRFAVGHYGATAQQYCVGWLIIDSGVVRYRAIQGNHGVHSFDFPFDRIKEIKKNALMFSMNMAFHVRLEDGEVFNFSQLDPNTLRFESPDGLINAVRTATGK